MPEGGGDYRTTGIGKCASERGYEDSPKFGRKKFEQANFYRHPVTW